MKICLIIPPSPFLLDERVFMHIGILKVASALESRGYFIDMLDLAGVPNFEDVITKYCSSKDTKVFALTATTPQIPFAVRVAKRLRELMPTCKIILGGTHVSLMHTASKKETQRGVSGRAVNDITRLKEIFDVLVAGDGEKSIFAALDLDNGVIDADDPKSDYFLSNDEFSLLPLPARHLVDINSYHYNIEGYKATSLIAQLGCPFKCTFCGGRNSPFLRKIRTRSSDSVIHEMEHLHRNYGFTGFMFYDDELNVNKQWEHLLQEIKKLQVKVGAEFRLRGFVKAELFTQRQADLMYDAGFRWLLTGFESGDERILTNIEKNATVEDNTKCVQFAKNAGLKVKALMSIGHCGESAQTILNTKNWLLDVKPEDFDCTIITPYPGSPYFDNAVKVDNYYKYTHPKTNDNLYQKDLDYFSEPDYYKGDPNGGYKSHVWTDHIDSITLVNSRESLEKEVRETLKIPFNPAGGVVKFEHSMGQGQIPVTILKNNYEGTIR